MNTGQVMLMATEAVPDTVNVSALTFRRQVDGGPEHTLSNLSVLSDVTARVPYTTISLEVCHD